MNKIVRLALLLLLSLQLLIAGCDRYRVTVNERVVSEPPRVLSSVDVPDPGLKSCIDQTIRDKRIGATNQLRTLVCTHAGIASLEGVQIFSKLRTLNLADNSLTSVSPLLFLGKLESVNLEGNEDLDCGGLEPLRAHLPSKGTLIAPGHCL